MRVCGRVGDILDREIPRPAQRGECQRIRGAGCRYYRGRAGWAGAVVNNRVSAAAGLGKRNRRPRAAQVDRIARACRANTIAGIFDAAASAVPGACRRCVFSRRPRLEREQEEKE